MNRLILIAVFAAAAVIPSQAESLLELYESASFHNADYRAAKARLESAKEEEPLARGILRPQVSANARETKDIDSGNQSRVFSVDASQILFDRSASLDQDEAVHRAAAAELEFAAAGQNLILTVAIGYLDALLERDTLQLIQARKAAFAEQLELAERNLEAGAGIQTDVLEATARLEETVAAEIAAERALEIRRRDLERISGVFPKTLIGLGGKFAVAPPTAGIAQWSVRAESQNPTLQSAVELLAAEGRRVASLRAQFLPKVSLNANYAHNSNEDRFDSDGSSTEVSIGVEMPLYVGGRRVAGIRRAMAREREASENLSAIRRDVQQRILSHYLQIESGAARIRALESAVRANRLALESTRIGYESGVRIISDVLDAQESLHNAEVQLREARYNYLANRLQLRAAAGELDDNFLREFTVHFAGDSE